MLFSYLLTTCVCFLATAYAKSQLFPFPQPHKQPNTQCKWKSKILIPICIDKVILSICISLWQQPSNNPTLKPTPHPTNKVRWVLLHFVVVVGIVGRLPNLLLLFLCSRPLPRLIHPQRSLRCNLLAVQQVKWVDDWLVNKLFYWCWISWIYSSYLHT